MEYATKQMQQSLEEIEAAVASGADKNVVLGLIQEHKQRVATFMVAVEDAIEEAEESAKP